LGIAPETIFVMDTDIALLVGVGLCQFALGWMGFRVTARPLQSVEEQRRFETAFVVVGLLGIALLIMSGIRTNNAMNSNFGVLGKKIDALTQKLETPPTTRMPMSLIAYCDVPDTSQNTLSALKIAGKQKITITTILGDSRGLRCAQNWAALLKQADWEVDGPNQAVFNTAMVGIIISVGAAPGRELGKQVSLNALPTAAAVLIQILQRSQKAFQLNLDQSVNDPNAVSLILGGEP
jgi:hypothetical protein